MPQTDVLYMFTSVNFEYNSIFGFYHSSGLIIIVLSLISSFTANYYPLLFLSLISWLNFKLLTITHKSYAITIKFKRLSYFSYCSRILLYLLLLKIIEILEIFSYTEIFTGIGLLNLWWHRLPGLTCVHSAALLMLSILLSLRFKGIISF